MSAKPFPTPDFNQAPLLAIWETTRSCELACRHCRAAAEPGRHREELSFEEGKALLDEVAAMSTPLCILSGGDPLNRPDLEDLIAHGKKRGLRMGTIPAATRNLTPARLDSLKAAGVDQIAFSIDAPTAELHDGIRGVPGSFDLTLQGARWARERGIPLQVNTCFGSWNFDQLEPMVELVKTLGIVFWEVFFLIPVGRGRDMKGLTPQQFESAFEKLYLLSLGRPFVVKLTEGQQFRRYCALRERGGVHVESRAEAPLHGIPGGVRVTSQAVNAGKGFVFIDFRGDVFPSGFLPVYGGSVRSRRLREIYRDSPLFKALRDPALLKGRCGRCEFAAICSGSRARAWAVTGDYLAADPGCAYVPSGQPVLPA